MGRIKLFVVDTGPLITLAAAGALDYLLNIAAEIILPDAVFYEATQDAAKLGASDILDWVQTNHAKIELAATKTYVVFQAAKLALPSLREAGLGERAAVEVIEMPDRLSAGERAVLLCEESAVLKRVVVQDRDRIVEISTIDLLRLLEERRKIQSWEQVISAAEQAGRVPSRAEKLPSHDRATQDAVRKLLG